MPKSKRKLTDKQKLFCREYLKDLSAKNAAIRAGFSPATADKIGSQLLGKSRIIHRIAKLKKLRARRVDIKADDVLRELMRLAFVDMSKAYDENGHLKPIKELPEEVRRAISSVEVQDLFRQRRKIGIVTKVRFWDKPKCLELIGKHLRLFPNSTELTGRNGKPIELENTKPQVILTMPANGREAKKLTTGNS